MRVLLLLCSVAAAMAATPSSTELAQKIATAKTINAEKVRAWAFREHQITLQLDKNGKETSRSSKTWDVIGLEGAPYRKLVERNDSPLPAKEAQKEEQAMRQEASARRKLSGPGLFSVHYTLSVPWQKLDRVYDLKITGEAEVAAHPVWLVEGSAKEGQRFSAPDEAEAANYTIHLWVRQNDGYPVRTEMDIVGDHSKLKKGSHVVLEDSEAADGTWLPGNVEVRFVLKVAGPFAARGLMTETFENFKRFQVDSTISVPDR